MQAEVEARAASRCDRCAIRSTGGRRLRRAGAELSAAAAGWPCAMGAACAAAAAACAAIDELSSAVRLLDGEGLYTEALAAARLTFCTLAVAGSYVVRSAPPVDALVIDEASQATEPETLIPLGALPRWALVCGDPRQLGSTVLSAAARAGGLGRSLLERLMVELEAPHLFLDTQYRMHPAISAFPSRRFYGGRLRDGVDARAAPWERRHGRCWLGPWSLVDVASGREERPGGAGGSLCNAAEAEAVAATVVALRDEWGVAVGDSAALRVLALYSAQVQRVRAALGARGVRGVAVSTVDGAQGAEASVVLVTVVRANGRKVGFVEEARRLNVAITRAQRSLVVFAHVATLAAQDGALGALVDHAAATAALYPEEAVGRYDERGRSALATFRRRPPKAAEAAEASEAEGSEEEAADADAAAAALRERLRELDEIEVAARNAEAEREAKRQRVEAERRAPFAPPAEYSSELVE